MPQMKAITLWQPWATLIAIGAKQYETRSWPTSHRGFLAIHSAKRKVRESEITDVMKVALESAGNEWYDLPLGSVLCIARLVDVVPTEAIVELSFDDERLMNEELEFGNYAPGRYAWKLEMVKVAPEPVPVKGMQGLWTWEYA